MGDLGKDPHQHRYLVAIREIRGKTLISNNGLEMVTVKYPKNKGLKYRHVIYCYPEISPKNCP